MLVGFGVVGASLRLRQRKMIQQAC
jgi:hypothetical protein